MTFSAALVGCAAQAAPAPDTSAERQKLQELLAARDELRKQEQAAPPEFVSRCGISDGDCRIIAEEKRAALVPTRGFLECSGLSESKASAPDALRACEDEQLSKRGKTEELSAYYEFENWCSAKVVDCTARLQQAADDEARRARAEERRKAIQATEESEALNSEVDFAEARLTYLRGTLPINNEKICKGVPEASACRERAKAEKESFDLELSKPEGKYDKQRAAQLYAAYRKTEAECYEPEYQCVLQKLEGYGGTAASKRWLDRNLDVMKKRETLVHKLAKDVAEPCLVKAATKYENLIIDRFQRYVKKPTVQPRAQLLAVFLLMHKEQVGCLQRIAK